jgi:hypothetical protein
MTKVGLKTKKISASVIEFEHLGVKREALLIMPYGMMANIPDESFIISFCQDGKEDSQICYPTDPINIDELEENEVAFGMPTENARIKFKTGNIINIRVGQTDSTDFAVRYNELKTQLDQLKSDHNNHVHTSASVGFTLIDGESMACSGSVGKPTANSTADFTNCKVSKVKLPSVAED